MSKSQQIAARRRTVATMMRDEYDRASENEMDGFSFYSGWAGAARRALVLLKELETGKRRLGRVRVPSDGARRGGRRS